MYIVQYDIHVTCMQGGKRNGSEKGEEGGKRYREGREEKGKRGGREEVNVIVLFVLRLSVRSSVDCPWDHNCHDI